VFTHLAPTFRLAAAHIKVIHGTQSTDHNSLGQLLFEECPAMAVAEDVLDKVRAGMRGLQAPGHFDKVYKNECMYSFDTPESPGGLYVNMKTWQVCKQQQGGRQHRSCLSGLAACVLILVLIT
jgi:hypothetical protein